MAEGLVGGVLGEGDDKPEVRAPEALAGPEAFAAAVAARLSASDPEVARDTSAFLKEQTQLLKVQKEHLKDEHAARLHYLRGQAREVDIRRFGLRMRVAFQLFIILVATVIGIFGAVLLHDAVTSRRVVIEPFDLSPSLAADSLSGKIVAAGILDKLNRLQAATQSSTQRATLTNAWERTISIAVPETGLSIGELSQMLRERFGHDVHIAGDLVQTPTNGLALTVRGTGVAPATFTGSAADLDKLTREAAEYVYGQARPALWAAYLLSNGRPAEAIAFARTAARRTDPVERARIFDMWSNGVANVGGSLREALALAREAVRLNPTDWGAYDDLMEWMVGVGDEEGAYRAGEGMQKLAGGRPGRAREVQYLRWDLLTWNLSTAIAGFSADLDATGGMGTNFGAQWPWLAWMQALDHDPDAAQFTISNARDDQGIANAAMVHRMNATLASELGDEAGATQEWEALAKLYAKHEGVEEVGTAICYVAPVLERMGRHADADASLAAVEKLTFVDCYRFRGDILDAREDWAGAQEWYAKAVKLGPSLPAGYYSWGLALAKHGDLAGAEAKLKDANQRGPHWADPLKAWADVLVKQGKFKEALGKYDEALKYAPNWKQLQEAREASAKEKT